MKLHSPFSSCWLNMNKQLSVCPLKVGMFQWFQNLMLKMEKKKSHNHITRKNYARHITLSAKTHELQ